VQTKDPYINYEEKKKK